MLTNIQKHDLEKAINSYSFPCVAYDFDNSVELKFKNIFQLESYIFKQLTSQNIEDLKNGLSNVLYWGYARAGYRDYRVQVFRSKIDDVHLNLVQQLFKKTLEPSISDIKKLSIPHFSGISFISKICMFLNPKLSAVLDLQIMKIKFAQFGKDTVLNNISHSLAETAIRASSPNSIAYASWCNRLFEISKNYFHSKFRVVDIERGFFVLILKNQIEYASRILADS